jgi:uncharacterized membrane protein YraQ (UPF0718 family)
VLHFAKPALAMGRKPTEAVQSHSGFSVEGCPCVEYSSGPACCSFDHQCGTMLVALRYFGITHGVVDAFRLTPEATPQLVLGIVIVSPTAILVPHEKVAKPLDEPAGLRGVVKATVIGALMPSGPFSSFPLVYALSQA